MIAKTTTVEEWRKLYDLAIQLKKLAPWQWMSEYELFGVKNPETSEIAFVSISGMNSNDLGLRCVRGSDGLYEFVDFLDNLPTASPAEIIQLPHILLAFTRRNNLAEAERQILQQIKFKPSRRGIYPAFRTYAPGFLPWLINREEARLLSYVLEQTIEVAKSSKQNDELLIPDEHEEGDVFVRVPITENGIMRWENQFLVIEPPDKLFLPPNIDDRSLMVLHQLPKRPQTLEIDAVMTPVPTLPEEDPDGRPYFPFLLLAMDSKNSTIYATELMRPMPSVEAMWRNLPQMLINLFARIGFIPAEVRTASEEVCEMIKTVSYRLKFTLRQADWLPGFQMAVTEVINTLIQDQEDLLFEEHDDEEDEDE